MYTQCKCTKAQKWLNPSLSPLFIACETRVIPRQKQRNSFLGGWKFFSPFCVEIIFCQKDCHRMAALFSGSWGEQTINLLANLVRTTQWTYFPGNWALYEDLKWCSTTPPKSLQLLLGAPSGVYVLVVGCGCGGVYYLLFRHSQPRRRKLPCLQVYGGRVTTFLLIKEETF